MKCRHCFSDPINTFLDLGYAPPSNAYLNESDLNKPELSYPLRIGVCENCWLVQTIDFAKAEELFKSDYAYFSSISTSWLAHAEGFVNMIVPKLNLSKDSLVIELASNDGYLLKNFLRLKIPCLGIEPTISTATAAEQLGVRVYKNFFSTTLAKKIALNGEKADLIIANNVYAHIPDINDFTKGIKTLLKANGVVTLEVQHLLELLKHSQFDTMYHEHFSYLSLNVVSKIFKENGLRVWDVEKLPTHGGSLRIYGCHEAAARKNTSRIQEILHEELSSGMQEIATYKTFATNINLIKYNLIKFLIDKKIDGKKIIAYGAAAKGNTLLNYAGIKSDLINFVCDASPFKQGKFMPGSHIPIINPIDIIKLKPDYLLILPWNISKEISEQLAYIKKWGGQFITAVPNLKFINTP